MSTDIPRNIAKKGRPSNRDEPNALISKKMYYLFGDMPYTDICKFFGISRESAKSYLSGNTFPGARELNNLREEYLKAFGHLIDLNWLLNDADQRTEPVFLPTELSSSPAASIADLLAIRSALQQQVAAIDRVIEGMS